MPNDRCVAASARAARAARSPIAIPPAGRSSARVRSRTLSGSFELQTSLAFGHPGPSQAFRIFKRSAPSSISDFENCSAPQRTPCRQALGPPVPCTSGGLAPGPQVPGPLRPRPQAPHDRFPPHPRAAVRLQIILWGLFQVSVQMKGRCYNGRSFTCRRFRPQGSVRAGRSRTRLLAGRKGGGMPRRRARSDAVPPARSGGDAWLHAR